jgi:TetR/AcrR family transcriptional regulator, transcriptional repressor for nem operon
MARPQEFEASEALKSAMRVFWRKGYEAASLNDILSATGLSKSSLYATFGDKRELFLAAFEAYRRERLQRLEIALNDGQPARQSIEKFFRQGVAHAESPEHAYGCMTANEAVELAPHDLDIQQLVMEDFQAVEQAFARAILRGQADGSIARDKEPRQLARFLVVSLQGLQVMTRAKSRRALLDDTLTVMLAALD